MITRRFFIAMFLGFVAGAGLIVGVFYLQLGVAAGSPMSRWSAALNERKLQIAAQKGTNKIVLIAGSSALFGLKASLLEKELGRPAVNLGSHAALGATYLLHMSKKAIKPGDLVVLGFEYELYNGDRFEREGPLVDYLIGHDPEYFQQFGPWQKLQAILSLSLDRLRLGVKFRFKAPKDVSFPEAYAIERLDACGDLIGIKYSGKPEHLNAITNWTSVLATGIYQYQGAFQSLREFVIWAKGNNVEVVAVFPPVYNHPAYHTDQARKSVAEIETFYKQLNVPILDKYTEALFPLDSFFDTPYHLIEDAAEQRTRSLLPKLKSLFEHDPPGIGR